MTAFSTAIWLGPSHSILFGLAQHNRLTWISTVAQSLTWCVTLGRIHNSLSLSFLFQKKGTISILQQVLVTTRDNAHKTSTFSWPQASYRQNPYFKGAQDILMQLSRHWHFHTIATICPTSRCVYENILIESFISLSPTFLCTVLNASPGPHLCLLMVEMKN